MKKGAKITLAVIGTVAGLGIIGAGIAAASGAAAATNFTEASLIEKHDTLIDYVSVSGVIESANFNGVYSTLSYPVESVNVQVGDNVRKGDILCTLNTDSLQDQILQQQAAVDSSNVSSDYQLSQAEKDYSNALEEYNNGTNSTIANAEFALAQAESALNKAQDNYDNAVEMSGKDKNTQLRSSEISLESAKLSLESAQKQYDNAVKESSGEDYYSIRNLKQSYEDARTAFIYAGMDKPVTEVERAERIYSEAYSSYIYYSGNPDKLPAGKSLSYYVDEVTKAERFAKSEIESFGLEREMDACFNALRAYEKAKYDIDEGHKNAVANAKLNLDSAKKSAESAEVALQSIKDNTSDGITAYKTQLLDAQLAYNNAKDNLALATKSVESTLASLKANAERERTLSGMNDSQLIALENLKEQLDEAVIKAPCDGTVTFVNCTKGAAPAGMLFAIEDQTDLKITANVREYEISRIKEGMRVIIKSDAVGEEYEGIVTRIAPTASKNPDGSDAGTSLFAVEIAVTSKDTALKIGMTSKLKIVTEEKNNVYAVTYDSIAVDENGNDIIYIAEKGAAGYTVKAVPVTVGMETDYLVEVSGEGISENSVVINDVALITDGQLVLIDETELGIAPDLSSDSQEGAAAE